jgi:hypothetical protein
VEEIGRGGEGVLPRVEGDPGSDGSGAAIEGSYRYALWRALDPQATKTRVLFVMLNPSTADASNDDPTLRRCLGFARAWKFGSLEVCNLFALRSQKPDALRIARDPIGPKNDAFLRAALGRARLVVAAWGAHPLAERRAPRVLRLLLGAGDVFCLGTTKEGAPRHPLYVRGSSAPRRFTAR